MPQGNGERSAPCPTTCRPLGGLVPSQFSGVVRRLWSRCDCGAAGERPVAHCVCAAPRGRRSAISARRQVHAFVTEELWVRHLFVVVGGRAAERRRAPRPGNSAEGWRGTDAGGLARAEASSPLLRRARAERQAVAAREVGAALLFPSNPAVSGAAGPRRDPSGNGLEFLLHAEQTIEIGGQRSARRAVVSRALVPPSCASSGARRAVARVRRRVRRGAAGRARVRRKGGARGADARAARRGPEPAQGGASLDVDLGWPD